jgi:hypothetical protein
VIMQKLGRYGRNSRVPLKLHERTDVNQWEDTHICTYLLLKRVYILERCFLFLRWAVVVGVSSNAWRIGGMLVGMMWSLSPSHCLLISNKLQSLLALENAVDCVTLLVLGVASLCTPRVVLMDKSMPWMGQISTEKLRLGQVVIGTSNVTEHKSALCSQLSHETLAELTIRGAVSYIALTFRDNDWPNPTRDEDGELGRLLSRLFQAFRAKDPAEKQQKALPACVFLEIAKLQHTETQRAISQLNTGAFYLAMQLCEYVKVPAA